MACGGYHTLVQTQENALFGFGSNVSGECGSSETKNLCKPTRIKIYKFKQAFDEYSRLMQEEESMQKAPPTEINIKTMVAGGKHSMVLSTCGQLFTFGYGQQG